MTFSICIHDRTTGKTKVTVGGSGTTFGEFLRNEGYVAQLGFIYRIEANLGGREKFTLVQPNDRIPGSVTDITLESCPKA